MKKSLLALLLALILVCSMATAGSASVTGSMLRVRSITLSDTSLILYAGREGASISASVEPATAVNKELAWSSSAPGVASVDAEGRVTPLKAGVAYIRCRATDGGDARKICKVIVKAVAPSSLTLNAAQLTLGVGESFTLIPTILPADATNKRVSWKSSNKKVATVNSKGVVTAKRAGGNCVISCRTKAGKITAQCAVTTDYSRSKVHYIAIAQEHYESASSLIGTLKDRANFLSAITGSSPSVYPPTGVTGYDLSASGILQLIRSAKKSLKIGSGDVTYFYYSGHGMGGGAYDKYTGALCGVDVDSYGAGLVTVSQLKKALNAIPGKVVVVLDSCYSGQVVSYNSPTTLSAKGDLSGARGFTQAFVRGFSGEDEVAAYSLPGAKGTTTLTTSKYKLLVACQPFELSWMNSSGSYYTSALNKAASGSPMGADANGNGRVSMAEFYGYVAPIVASASSNVQNIMVWPSGDEFTVFGKIAA